jgi:cobalt-zinc-cadmium efflux system outer membrane protein
MSRRLATAVLVLGATLAGCAPLPTDDGRTGTADLLAARGHELVAADGDASVAPLLAALRERPLTASDAVRLALLNNPDMKAEYASLGFAAAEVYEAGRIGNPVLSASVLFPDAGGEANQIGFGLAQGFTDVLLLRSRSRLAEGEYARAREMIGAKALALAADTEAAHIRVVGSWQLIAMREAVAKAATAAAELAERFFAAGNIGRLELALQQAAAAEARLDVLRARAELGAARSALNGLMGLAPTEDCWRVVDRLPVPLAAQDAIPDLLQRADASRLDLAAARREVALLADALGTTRSFRLLGDVEAGVETERETDRSRITGPTLALELPLFDHGQGRMARAQASLQRAQAQLRALEIDIGNAVRRSAAEVDAAKTRADHYRESLIPLREEIVARTQREVNFMLADQFQLLFVKQQEYDAYQGYLEAVRDYWLARVELGRAVGAALPGSARAGETAHDAQMPMLPKSGPQHTDHAQHSPHEGTMTPAAPHATHESSHGDRP